MDKEQQPEDAEVDKGLENRVSFAKGIDLYKHDKVLLRAIWRKVKRLAHDCHHGQQVKKRLIPEKYRHAYDITNLYRVRLPKGWRLLYTIAHEGGNTRIIILGIMDHKEYERLFDY